MKLSTLTREQVQTVRDWRNEDIKILRTSYLLTEKMQDDFFDNVINNRDSKHRYFAILENEDNPYVGTGFIGMCGITNIEWENGTAEISLIISPEYRGKGNGKKAVELLFEEAFKNMRLYSVFGEVYDCGNRGFWEKVVKKYNGYMTNLVNRKFYNGTSHDSMWFSVNKYSFASLGIEV